MPARKFCCKDTTNKLINDNLYLHNDKSILSDFSIDYYNTLVCFLAQSSCPFGCTKCSKWNGCVDCAMNFTWHFEKSQLRTIGVCLRKCPAGYLMQSSTTAPGHYKCTGK